MFRWICPLGLGERRELARSRNQTREMLRAAMAEVDRKCEAVGAAQLRRDQVCSPLLEMRWEDKPEVQMSINRRHILTGLAVAVPSTAVAADADAPNPAAELFRLESSTRRTWLERGETATLWCHNSRCGHRGPAGLH